MKIAPSKICFSEKAFAELITQALKSDVLTYNPPRFKVSSVGHDDGLMQWIVYLETEPDPPPKEESK